MFNKEFAIAAVLSITCLVIILAIILAAMIHTRNAIKSDREAVTSLRLAGYNVITSKLRERLSEWHDTRVEAISYLDAGNPVRAYDLLIGADLSGTIVPDERRRK